MSNGLKKFVLVLKKVLFTMFLFLVTTVVNALPILVGFSLPDLEEDFSQKSIWFKFSSSVITFLFLISPVYGLSYTFYDSIERIKKKFYPFLYGILWFNAFILLFIHYHFELLKFT